MTLEPHYLLLAFPPVITNLLPLIVILGIWLIARPLLRRWESRKVQQALRAIGRQTVFTKSQFIWKIGVLYWGGVMFLFFVVVGPLITHFTMGKPLTIDVYVSGGAKSALICFPGGALFGWLLWRLTQNKLDINQ